MRWIEGIACDERHRERFGRVVEELVTKIPEFCDNEA